LVAREPNAPPVAREGDRDVPLARKGDYLIPRVKPPPNLAAHWVPSTPAVKMDGGLLNEGLPSIEGPSCRRQIRRHPQRTSRCRLKQRRIIRTMIAMCVRRMACGARTSIKAITGTLGVA
jgi:hypothetical protein